jgi:hypothetical protein
MSITGNDVYRDVHLTLAAETFAPMAFSELALTLRDLLG